MKDLKEKTIDSTKRHPFVTFAIVFFILLAVYNLIGGFSVNSSDETSTKQGDISQSVVSNKQASSIQTSNLQQERDGLLVQVEVSKSNNSRLDVVCNVKITSKTKLCPITSSQCILPSESMGVINVYDDTSKIMYARINPMFGGEMESSSSYSFSNSFDITKCWSKEGLSECSYGFDHPIWVGCSIYAVAPPLESIGAPVFLDNWKAKGDEDKIFIFEIKPSDIK